MAERNAGTLVRLLVAPLTRTHVLLGKALACFVAILAVEALLLLVGAVAFRVRPASPGLLVAACLAVAVAFVGLMMLISTLGQTERSASGAGWAILLVLSMLGGGMVPLFVMPAWMADGQPPEPGEVGGARARGRALARLHGGGHGAALRHPPGCGATRFRVRRAPVPDRLTYYNAAASRLVSGAATGRCGNPGNIEEGLTGVRFDYVLVGGGLQSALLVLALRARRPGARIALVERDSRLGGNHTWSFHEGDVGAAALAWLEPLVEHRWPSYDVRFPGLRRRLEIGYSSLTSPRLDAVVRGALASAPDRSFVSACRRWASTAIAWCWATGG